MQPHSCRRLLSSRVSPPWFHVNLGIVDERQMPANALSCRKAARQYQTCKEMLVQRRVCRTSII
ncbi:hypothetical protein RHECNPAF_1760078 [Rhizobium etli CNPAF512]|nr:hypothetical protein RHECNPAF_1760078 [Rhizobium etli CNPAF512]